MGRSWPHHHRRTSHLLPVLLHLRPQKTKTGISTIRWYWVSSIITSASQIAPQLTSFHSWALGRTPPGHGAATYNQQPYYANQQSHYQSGNPPPPAYGASQDYYSRQNDVELQSPPAAYGAQYNRGDADNAYAPPPGPPPAKNDGIIR